MTFPTEGEPHLGGGPFGVGLRFDHVLTLDHNTRMALTVRIQIRFHHGNTGPPRAAALPKLRHRPTPARRSHRRHAQRRQWRQRHRGLGRLALDAAMRRWQMEPMFMSFSSTGKLQRNWFAAHACTFTTPATAAREALLRRIGSAYRRRPSSRASAPFRARQRRARHLAARAALADQGASRTCDERPHRRAGGARRQISEDAPLRASRLRSITKVESALRRTSQSQERAVGASLQADMPGDTPAKNRGARRQ